MFTGNPDLDGTIYINQTLTGLSPSSYYQLQYTFYTKFAPDDGSSECSFTASIDGSAVSEFNVTTDYTKNTTNQALYFVENDSAVLRFELLCSATNGGNVALDDITFAKTVDCSP